MDIPRANWVLPAGRWPHAEQVGSVTLDWDDRHRRRIRLSVDGGGRDILLDLKSASRLADGDGLLLEDGGIVRVIAAAEPLLRIRAGSCTLARLAYHLGNRHLPIELGDDYLLIRRDHVIEDMVIGLGGDCVPVDGPFTPEPGAYGGGHSHAGDHDHDHPHPHD